MTTAIYPGSFNPWTLGHQNILERALKIFNKIIIVIAINDKKNIDPNFIEFTLNPLKSSCVEIKQHIGLISDFNLPIIRGIRNGDWEYESNLAYWNKQLGCETVFINADEKYANISSTSIRELIKHNKNVSAYTNLYNIERWKTKRFPSSSISFGKIAVEKSIALNGLSKDCDKLFWDYFDSTAYKEKYNIDYKDTIKNAIMYRPEKYRNIINTIDGFIDWESFLNPKYNYEMGPIGSYWHLIPFNVLSKFCIIKVVSSYKSRMIKLKKRNILNTYKYFDNVYVDAPIIDHVLEL